MIYISLGLYACEEDDLLITAHRVQNQALRKWCESIINSWGLVQGPSAETMAWVGCCNIVVVALAALGQVFSIIVMVGEIYATSR